MKTPEILREKAPESEPVRVQEVVSAYVRALDGAQLKRDVLRQQIEGRRMEQAMV
jgi:hypothetical protein